MKKKSLFHWSVVASFFASLVLTVAAQAADMRTVAVVSVADLDTAVKTLKAVTTEAGYPDAMAQADMMIPMFLQGLDTKQPIGIVIQADDESFAGYAFLPIADISAMPALSMFVAGGEKQADGSILIPLGHPMVPSAYLKQSGKWAFVSLTELPKTLPTDPAKLLEGMDKQYLIGVKANIANLPKELCLDTMNGIRVMAEMSAATESDAEGIAATFDQIEMVLEQVKTLNIGIGVSADNDIIMETTTDAVAGTVLAADIQSMMTFKTGQIGFYQPEGSIGSVLLTGVLNEILKRQYKAQLSSFFEGAREGIEDGDLVDADEIDAAKTILSNVEAMLLSTIESGKVDAGVTWQANGTMLVGATIQDGNKLKEAFEQSILAVPEDFQKYLKINESELEGYAVSSIVVPVADLPLPEEDESIQQFRDKTLTAQIGIKDTAIAVALGWDSNVKADFAKAISASKSPAAVPKQYMVVTPYYLGELFESIAPKDDPQVQKLIDMMTAFGTSGQMTAEMTFSDTAQFDKVVISHQMLPGIGKLIQGVMEARAAATQFGRDYYENDEDLEIEEFDF